MTGPGLLEGLLGLPPFGSFGSAAGAGGAAVFNFDFTTMPDGALPSAFTGATWAISSGAAVNAPTLGAELLTDPGLEANYTAGKCDTLTINGTPTVAESADVHGGTKAQQLECTATNQWLRFPQVAAVKGTWYRGSFWQKLTVGAVSLDFKALFTQGAGFPSGGAGFAGLINSAVYTKKQTSFLANSTAVMSLYCFYAFATGRTGIVDDCSLKAITGADLFAMVVGTNRLATVKIQPSAIADNTVTGVIAWANDTASPDTFLMATINWRSSENGLEVGLMKFVAGEPTQLINPTFQVEVADAWLEIRPTDSDTVGLYYNNVQVGTDKDVTDVPGSAAGMFCSGGNNVKSFFMG